jgi:hypothetical protein
MDGLIGHTGFIGSNLKEQRSFDQMYRSTDIERIKGQRFRQLVCAGVTAVKWWANQNSDEDRDGICRLIAHLDAVEAEAFILISTVDVYGDPVGVSETTEASPSHPYGANRLMLEHFVEKRFPTHSIVRLPALFGSNLKKNALFDLLTQNRVEYIAAAGQFQWYPLSRLSQDIEIVVDKNLPLVNFATESLPMSAIVDRFFPGAPVGTVAAGASPRYDVQTEFAHVFGKQGRYIMSVDEVLNEMGTYISKARR